MYDCPHGDVEHSSYSGCIKIVMLIQMREMVNFFYKCVPLYFVKTLYLIGPDKLVKQGYVNKKNGRHDNGTCP